MVVAPPKLLIFVGPSPVSTAPAATSRANLAKRPALSRTLWGAQSRRSSGTKTKQMCRLRRWVQTLSKQGRTISTLPQSGNRHPRPLPPPPKRQQRPLLPPPARWGCLAKTSTPLSVQTFPPLRGQLVCPRRTSAKRLAPLRHLPPVRRQRRAAVPPPKEISKCFPWGRTTRSKAR